MKRDFQKELQDFINRASQEQRLTVKFKETIKEDEPLFNIHKRSLPVGIDKAIVFNLTEGEADYLLETKLKTSVKKNDDGTLGTVTYYDKIRNTETKKSIFDNPKGIAINWKD